MVVRENGPQRRTTASKANVKKGSSIVFNWAVVWQVWLINDHENKINLPKLKCGVVKI